MWMPLGAEGMRQGLLAAIATLASGTLKDCCQPSKRPGWAHLAVLFLTIGLPGDDPAARENFTSSGCANDTMMGGIAARQAA